MSIIRKITQDPSLTASVPTDNATNVAPGATIVLTFSQTMTVGTGNLKIVNDSDDGSPTETIAVTAPAQGQFAWSNSNHTLTITPGIALAAGKSYHIEIDATAFNGVAAAYPGISDSTTLNFTMVSGPAFSSITPAASAFVKSGFSVGYTLSKTAASGSITYTRTGGTADAGSPETCTLQGAALTTGAGRSVGLGLNADGCTAAVTLVDGAIYTIDFSATDSIPLTGTAGITGVTYDTTAPDKHATAPITAVDADTSNSYTASDTLTLQFTEPVDTTKATLANLTVSGGHTLGTGAQIVAVGEVNGYAQSYAITLGDNPSIAAADTLTIGTANVVDRAGNLAAADVVFTVPAFNTAPEAPTGATATAGDGSVSLAFTAPANNGGASITEYTASCAPANQFSALTWTSSNIGASSPITVSGLTNGTAYKCRVKAKNSVGYGSYSSLSNSFTPAAAPVAPPANSGGTDAPTPTTTELPTGGGTATLTGGQSVTVTENGKDGTSINLPPPSTTPGTPTSGNSVNLTLPGTGTIGVSSNSAGTQLGVTHITLPGATTSVSTMTVNQGGNASFTASEKGQAMAGLKNGIVVVSGAKDSQVSVDATGANTTIGVKSSDTLIVPTGTPQVSGTKVDLPPPTASGGAASTVSVKIGSQSLTIQANQPDTTMTFEVVDIGGVQTPVLAVTGSAQVSGSGDNQPIVSIAGNLIRTGKSGGGSQVCNTIVQASSDTSSDAVHVVTCYIVLDAGSFSALGGGRNGFAAIKDGIVWAGETAEFDKSGKVTLAYLGSRSGNSDAVGDDMVPGGNKFTVGGYQVGAFIPRLSGTPLRLNGAKLDESIFAVVKKALGVDMLPSTPSQSVQGVLNFNFTGDLTGQGVTGSASNVTYTVNSNTASVLPSRRVRVDTNRADGVSISAEGAVDVATGGLVTTLVATVPDPKAFAEKLNQVLPGATSILRWNGSWQVKTADGVTYIGRPLWSYWTAAPGAEAFSTLANGNVLFSDNGIAQPLFPDFYDYDTLQATFRKELNDPNLTVLPRMDGTAVATVNGVAYIIAPQWNAFQPPAGKPAWWLENDVFYIKNFDGSAQGFTVK